MVLIMKEEIIITKRLHLQKFPGGSTGINIVVWSSSESFRAIKTIKAVHFITNPPLTVTLCHIQDDRGVWVSSHCQIKT